MSFAAASFVLVAAFVTATVSGVLGMAGGLLLMGALLLVLPAAVAFVVHGLLQLVSNGWRAFLQRRHLRWGVVGWYAAGAVLAGGLVALGSYTPDKALTYLLLGLVPGLVWLPEKALALDAERPPHAVLAGFAVTALNLVAGVAGPLLDVFFVRTTMGRHSIVATKAGTQVLSHTAKVAVYTGPALTGDGIGVPFGLVLLAAPLSMLGTALGGRLLNRMSDASFASATRWVVTGIGVVYLVQAARLAWS